MRVTEVHVGGQLHVAQNIPGGIPDPISPICLGGGILPPINGTAWIEGPCIDLFRVEAGAGLTRMFGCALGAITYGRTALIYCNGEPAIELIEIVAPV